MGIQMLVPLGKEKVVLVSEIAGAVIDLVINIILIPFIASAGAAIGTLIAELFVWIVQFKTLKRVVIPAYKEVEIFKIIVAILPGIVLSFFIKQLNINVFFVLLISASAFFGTYAIVLFILNEKLVLEIFSQLKNKVMNRKRN